MYFIVNTALHRIVGWASSPETARRYVLTDTATEHLVLVGSRSDMRRLPQETIDELCYEDALTKSELWGYLRTHRQDFARIRKLGLARALRRLYRRMPPGKDDDPGAIPAPWSVEWLCSLLTCNEAALSNAVSEVKHNKRNPLPLERKGAAYVRSE
jgi:hypothetical protein